MRRFGLLIVTALCVGGGLVTRAQAQCSGRAANNHLRHCATCSRRPHATPRICRAARDRSAVTGNVDKDVQNAMCDRLVAFAVYNSNPVCGGGDALIEVIKTAYYTWRTRGEAVAVYSLPRRRNPRYARARKHALRAHLFRAPVPLACQTGDPRATSRTRQMSIPVPIRTIRLGYKKALFAHFARDSSAAREGLRGPPSVSYFASYASVPYHIDQEFIDRASRRSYGEHYYTNCLQVVHFIHPPTHSCAFGVWEPIARKHAWRLCRGAHGHLTKQRGGDMVTSPLTNTWLWRYAHLTKPAQTNMAT